MPAGQYSSAQQRITFVAVILFALVVFAIVLLTASSCPVWTTANGEQVPDGTIHTLIADDHCGWESSTLLHIGSPIGTVMDYGTNFHQYIRDPESVYIHPGLARSFKTTFNPNATPPLDAKFSGFNRDGVELWISDSELDSAVYMISESSTERWPKADPPIFCD
jgi:hypothetical protein